MLEFLGSIFLHHPLRILGVAVLFLAVWGLLRGGVLPARHPDAFLWPAGFCLLWAGWEWLVMTRTPEADIRIDLLLIGPVLLGLTVFALVRVFR